MFEVPFIQAWGPWFLFIVKSPPCGDWTSGLSSLPGWGNLCLSDEWIWISFLWSAMKCPIKSFEMSLSLVWLWSVHLLMFSVVFLFCWRISVVCLALELVSSWVKLGFSVGMETFGLALAYFCSPWSGVL